MALMLSRGFLAFLPLMLVIVALAAPAVTANDMKCGHHKRHRHHSHAPAPVPASLTRPFSIAAPAPSSSGGMSSSTMPAPASAAEAPATSPVGAEHSSGADIVPFAWQAVVLGVAVAAAAMLV